MKKALLLILLLFTVFTLFSAEYDSDEMISKYFKVEPLDKESKEYKTWEETKVSLITVSKEDPVYSWFGHTAILIEYPEASVVFDYGNFSFGEDFYWNFILGRLWYKCCCSYADFEMQFWKGNRRTVTKTELDISPEKKKALDSFLWTNVSPEHNTYLYHNYKDNCATRIRDLLNILSDGDFKAWATSKDGVSYRKQTSTILHNSLFLQWLFELIQGHEADEYCSVWDEMFLPKNLEKYLLEYGKLGSETEYVIDFRNDPSRKTDFENPKSCVLFGAILGVILLLAVFAARKTNRQGLYKGVTFTVHLIIGLLGTLSFFMMTFTLHDYCYNNENIFFINPLALVCAVLAFSKKKNCIKVRCIIHWILTALLLLLIILKVILPGIFFQVNWAQILTFLPYYLFVAVCCKRDYNNT